MITFIAGRIEKAADISTKRGIEKYKAYFVKTKLYAKYREDVDTILRTDGYDEVIISD